MRFAILGVQWLIRLLAVVQVTLGVLFWTGNAYSLIQLHMLTGITLVLGLWVQAAFLTGDLHWLIKIAHLLIGLGAVGQAESLAVRALRGVLHGQAQTGYTAA